MKKKYLCVCVCVWVCAWVCVCVCAWGGRDNFSEKVKEPCLWMRTHSNSKQGDTQKNTDKYKYK